MKISAPVAKNSTNSPIRWALEFESDSIIGGEYGATVSAVEGEQMYKLSLESASSVNIYLRDSDQMR